jgi:hypothetical protein
MESQRLQRCLDELIAHEFREFRTRDIELVHHPDLSPLMSCGMICIVGRERDELVYSDDLPLADDAVIKGVLSHELAHIYQMTSWKWRLLDLFAYPLLRKVHILDEWYHTRIPRLGRHDEGFYSSVFRGNDKKRREYAHWLERNADLIAVKHGCQQYLLAYDSAVYR